MVIILYLTLFYLNNEIAKGFFLQLIYLYIFIFNQYIFVKILSWKKSTKTFEGFISRL